MEIDINIEGYNVNGICVGCLNYNRRMFYHEEVKECFKFLANIEVPDGLSVQVCWECLPQVRRACQFRKQLLVSYEALINYSRQHTFLNSPTDLANYATTRLSVTTPDACELLFVPQFNVKDEVIKIETENLIVNADDRASLKSEFESLVDDDEGNFGDITAKDEISSDDDLQLSRLKQKKEKRKKTKKSRKKSVRDKEKYNVDPKKKLKNLPEELVAVYTMSEEEMWAVRAEDQTNKYFGLFKHSCSSCLLSFNTEKLKTEHVNGKHRVKGNDCRQCDVCRAYFLTKDHLYAHRAIHLVAYRCKVCEFKTSMKAIMSRHTREHQGDIVEEFKCKVCDKLFGSRSRLAYHVSKNHRERIQCDCCGKVFASKVTLKYHLRMLNKIKDEKPKEKLYIPCKGCTKVFHTKKSYRAHVVIHNGITYPCPICGKLFQWKRNLARHTRNHREKDEGALHECRECGKTFASRDCYNNHMRLSKRHVPEDAYVHQCNYCGKKFATRWCMIDHVDWDHLKVIKYQCSICFKPFKTAKIMVAHMNNIHEGKRSKEPEGEHLCEICGKSYKTVKRLKGHVWAMHTKRSSAKSYKCKLCPATFAWQTSIYKHMKMMHDNKRNKQSRLPVKKQEPYPDIEAATRMQYFQQNPLQSIVLGPTATHGV